MSHPNKAKGTAFETLVSRFTGNKRIGSVNGSNDQGDLDDADWIMECKDEQRIDLAGYMTELDAELMNSDKCRWGVAIVKRRKRNVADAYAVMPLYQWRSLRDYVRHLEAGGTPGHGLDVFMGSEG